MRKLINELKNRKIEENTLKKFGFTFLDNYYIYKELIYNEKFEVVIKIKDNEVYSLVNEIELDEEYILVDILNSQGEFVTKIREEYTEIINKFINNCTTINIFKTKQANSVINYIKEKYNDELEYLWEKYPNNAIFRNKNNKKWYGALLTIHSSKLNISSDEVIEIIDLRFQNSLINNFIDHKKVFPGYHMNKKNWITIILNESMNDEELFKLIDNSYDLSKK